MMMGMMDMKMPKKSKKDMEPKAVGSSSSEQPEYPYGLEISLGDESIKKFPGLMDKVVMGKEMTGQFKAHVKSMRQEKMHDGSMSSHMTLQIEKMGLTHDDDYEGAFDEAAKGEKKGGM